MREVDYRMVMIIGLFIFGSCSLLHLYTIQLVQILVLALQGIALSFTMVPCMLEVKAAGGNFVGAAFVFELGYSLNILIWGTYGNLMAHFTEQ